MESEGIVSTETIYSSLASVKFAIVTTDSMPKIQRSSDVIEVHSERAIFYIIGGIIAGAGAFLFLKYQGSGSLNGLAVILAIAAVLLVGFGMYLIYMAGRVTRITVKCPFCYELNDLVEAPKDEDITCVACNRMIPIKEGNVLEVSQVKCGFCQSLNYYSDKTELLLCENCNHEIPLHQEDGAPKKQLPKGFAVVDDNQSYELVLVDAGAKSEELVSTLQKMLALNRNQVKDILDQCPVTLLQGIPKMKCEMLSAQISNQGAKAESRVLQQSS